MYASTSGVSIEGDDAARRDAARESHEVKPTVREVSRTHTRGREVASAADRTVKDVCEQRSA